MKNRTIIVTATLLVVSIANYSRIISNGTIKSSYHKMLGSYLRKGGVIIFEAFSKKHLDYILKNEKVGGPKDIDSLFSIEEIKSDFPNYDVEELVEKEIDLSEGLFHNGTGSVIRFVGRKK